MTVLDAIEHVSGVEASRKVRESDPKRGRSSGNAPLNHDKRASHVRSKSKQECSYLGL